MNELQVTAIFVPSWTRPQWIRNLKKKLTYCDLVTPYGDIVLGLLCLRLWLCVVKQQAITWANVDFSLVRFCCGIHLLLISQAIILYNEIQNYIIKITATSPRSQLVDGIYTLWMTRTASNEITHLIHENIRTLVPKAVISGRDNCIPQYSLGCNRQDPG